MTIPTLTKASIRQHTTDQSFRRGQDYHRQGHVISLVQRGAEIQAEVEGNQYVPYQVHVAFDEGGVTTATCSCPYDWGGWCKHIVAALLAGLHEPDSIETRPALAELLADLNREQLQAVLLNLATGNPGLATAIESQVALLTAAPTGPPAPRPRRTTVDPRPIRRQVQAALRVHSLDRMRPSEAYWHVDGVVNEVRQLLDQVREFIAAGDGPNTLIVLEAITDEYVSDWTCLDGSDGSTGEFFGDLGPIWTQALLAAELSPAERQQART